MSSEYRMQATALIVRMLLAAMALTMLAFVVRRLVGSAFTEGALFVYDTSRAQWLRQNETPGITLVMRFISALHGTVGILSLTAAFAWWLQRRGDAAWGIHVALTVIGALLTNVALKHVFSRARPTFGGVPASLHSFSFPSGHTVGATVFYGLFVMVVCGLTHRVAVRAAVVVGAGAMVFWVASSRFYLGAHFISDTVGGFVVGLMWLACCLGSWPKRREVATASSSAPAALATASSASAPLGS